MLMTKADLETIELKRSKRKFQFINAQLWPKLSGYLFSRRWPKILV